MMESLGIGHAPSHCVSWFQSSLAPAHQFEAWCPYWPDMTTWMVAGGASPSASWSI